jgi:hypothetical protein
MTNDNRDDRQAASSEPETTVVEPVTAQVPELAWSQDTAEVYTGPTNRSRLIWTGLVGLVVVIAAALIYLAATLFGIGSPKHVEPPTNSAIPRHGGYSTDDQRFLDWLDRMTNRPAITDASQAVSLAHDACRDLPQGVDADLVNKQVSKETGWSIDDAYQFISIAMTLYPNCGVIGGP